MIKVAHWETIEDIERECAQGDDPECVINRIRSMIEIRHGLSESGTALLEACQLVRDIPGGIDPRVRAACDLAISRVSNRNR